MENQTIRKRGCIRGLLAVLLISFGFMFLVVNIGLYSLNRLTTEIGQVAGEVGEAAGEIGGEIGESAGGFGSAIGQFFGRFGQAMGEVFGNFGQAVDGFFGSIGSNLASMMTTVISVMLVLAGLFLIFRPDHRRTASEKAKHDFDYLD